MQLHQNIGHIIARLPYEMTTVVQDELAARYQVIPTPRGVGFGMLDVFANTISSIDPGFCE